MKRGPTKNKANPVIKKSKTSTREFLRLVSETYQCFTERNTQLELEKSDIQKINEYIKDSAMLETAFEKMPDKILQTAIIIAATTSNFQFLDALLNNDTILQSVDVHKILSKTRHSENRSALNLAIALAYRNDNGGVLQCLFNKIPYSQIMTASVKEEEKTLVHQMLLQQNSTSPFLHTHLLPKLLLEKDFQDFIQSLLDDSEDSFNEIVAYACLISGQCPDFLEHVLLSNQSIQRCRGFLSENSNLIYPMLMTAVNCARKGRSDLLKRVLENNLNSPFHTKLEKVIPAQLLKELFNQMALCCDQDLQLAETINQYLACQEVDIQELEQNLQKSQLENAIKESDIVALKSLISQGNVNLDCIPAIALFINKVNTDLLSNGNRSLVENENAFEMIMLLIKNKANIEKEYMGITPIFFAIMCDLQHGTSLTQLLLDTLEQNDVKINVNAQCTFAISEQIQQQANAFVGNDTCEQVAINMALNMIDHVFPKNMTPLHLCLTFPKMMELQGMSLKQQTINAKQKELIQTLLCHKPDFTLEDANGNTVLAVLKGELEKKTRNVDDMEGSDATKEVEEFLKNFAHQHLSDDELSNDDSSNDDSSNDELNQQELISQLGKMMAAKTDISNQQLILKEAIGDFNRDVQVSVAAVQTLSATPIPLPADIIVNITQRAICPAYKSQWRNERDINKLTQDVEEIRNRNGRSYG